MIKKVYCKFCKKLRSAYIRRTWDVDDFPKDTDSAYATFEKYRILHHTTGIINKKRCKGSGKIITKQIDYRVPQAKVGC